MALHLHRAPRTDLLADALGDLLSTPLEDPFATGSCWSRPAGSSAG